MNLTESFQINKIPNFLYTIQHINFSHLPHMTIEIVPGKRVCPSLPYG